MSRIIKNVLLHLKKLCYCVTLEFLHINRFSWKFLWILTLKDANFDLWVLWRSHKVSSKFTFSFLLKSNHILWDLTLWRHQFFTKWSLTPKVMKGHMRPFHLSSFSLFICQPILINIYRNNNIIKTQLCYVMKYDLKGHIRYKYNHGLTFLWTFFVLVS